VAGAATGAATVAVYFSWVNLVPAGGTVVFLAAEAVGAGVGYIVFRGVAGEAYDVLVKHLPATSSLTDFLREGMQ